MRPIMHLSADYSPITYSGSNNSTISKVYDIAGIYDATATGNVYLEEFEGIKGFAFKSQTSYLKGLTFPALGSTDFSLAVTFANTDPALASNTGAAFGVGDTFLTGRYLGVLGTSPSTQLASSVAYGATNVSTSCLSGNKWNALILTFDSISQNVVIYANSINNFASLVQALNISQFYMFNVLGPTNPSNGMKGSYTNEAMIFNTKLSDTQINGLFGYFNQRLSPSTQGLAKTRVRNTVFNRKVV